MSQPKDTEKGAQYPSQAKRPDEQPGASEGISLSFATGGDAPAQAPGATVDFGQPKPPDPLATVDVEPEHNLKDTAKQLKKPDPSATIGLEHSAESDNAFLLDGSPLGDSSTMALPNEEAERATPERPTVAGYQILGELGRGGMGVVYKARQTKLDRIVALKMVLAGAHAGPDQLARFYTEAQAVAHLQHANIVQIYEVGEQAGLPYFSLEFIDGGSLADKTAGKPQEVGYAAEMVERLSRAMHHAHQHGVVHRDLKPMNVLLMRDGTPKITDFGLAKRLEGESSSQTRSGAILGTPSYMAPEQALGEVHQIGPLTDVYALGAMLYELLTGRPPFLAATPMDTVIQVTRDEPVPPTQLQPSVPRDLETICMKCLQKEQPKRYASAGELAEDLRRFLAGEPILARPVSTPERLWRWCRRNPKIAALSAAVVLLLASVATVSTTMAFQIAHERDQTDLERKEAVKARDLAKQKAQEAEEARGIADANAEAEKAARQLADQKTEEARAAQEVADTNGILAVNTLYNVVNKVHNQLKDRPDLQKLSQDIVDDAMKGLEKVTGGAQSSALASRTRGVAHQKRGDISIQLGQTEQALEEYKQGRATYEALMAADSTSDVAKYSLAVLCEKVGDATHQLEAIAAAALPYYQQSLELREALGAQETLVLPVTRALVQQSLATIYSKQWNLSVMLGDPPRAFDFYRKLEAMLPPGTTNQPQAYPPSFYLRISNLHFHMGNVEDCRSNCEKALELSKAALANDALSVSAQRDLAGSYGSLGDLELQVGNPELAQEHYRQAYEFQRTLAAKDPDSSDAQRELSLALYRLGTAELARGKVEESREHYLEALNIRRKWATADPRNAYKQVEYFLSLARCGNHKEAAEMAGELYKRVQEDPGMLFFVACGYALCAPAVAFDKPSDQLGPDERNLQRQYAEQAIKVLDDAITHGFKDRMALEHDPDLDPVRELPGFKVLLEKVK